MSQVSYLSSSLSWFLFLAITQTANHNGQCLSENKNVYVAELVGDIDDESLREELKTSRHFLLDSEIGNGRPRVFNFAMDILDAHTLSHSVREPQVGSKV